MKKIFRKEVVIGIIVAVALAILVVGIDFLKGINVFKPSNYYTAVYENVSGLTVSAPVTVSGYKVGQVSDISYMYDKPGHVAVEISLDRQLKLPKGTKAVIKVDMLGTAAVVLDMAPGTDYLAVGAELPGVLAPGLMDDVSKDLLPTTSQVLTKVDSVLTAVNRLLSDPALGASVGRLDQITGNLAVATKQLNAILGTLPPITKDVKQITGNVTTLTQDLNHLSATLNALPIDSTMRELQGAATNLNALTQRLNNTDSTIGKLTTDPALYNDLNKTVQSLDALLQDIKANPKRYISIKLL